jgi:hypothetical protein
MDMLAYLAVLGQLAGELGRAIARGGNLQDRAEIVQPVANTAVLTFRENLKNVSPKRPYAATTLQRAMRRKVMRT